MSLSIQSTPGVFYSVNGDLIFTVCDIVKASDPVTYADFKYVCDVYIGSTFVARLKAYPNPTNKIGVFNVSNIIRSYIAATFNPTPSILQPQNLASGEFSITATMKFGYEYNFTLTADVVTDSARTYFGHYNGRLIGQQTNLSDYDNRIASIRPLITPVNRDDNFCFIPAFVGTINNGNIEVDTFLDNGTMQSFFIDGLSLPTANTMYMLNVSPGAINAVHPGKITSATSYYDVKFQPYTPFYETKVRLKLTCEAKYEVFTLHFLNRFGGFESRNFTKVSRKTIDIEKSEFGKLGYTMDSSGIISYNNANKVINETRSVYSSQFKEKMVLNTDILSDDEYTWLADLIVSPMIYIEMSGYFVPCVIVSNNYEFRKTKNDNLTNITVNIEFGEQFNAQYR